MIYTIITRIDEGGQYWVAKDANGSIIWCTRSYLSKQKCKESLIAHVTEMASEQEVERVEL